MKHHKSNVAAATYAVFFLPWAIGEKDEFVRYHQKQATVLVIAGLVGQGIIGVLGWWFSFLGLWSLWSSVVVILVWTLRLFLAYEIITGARAALAGEQKPLPLIGKFVHGL